MKTYLGYLNQMATTVEQKFADKAEKMSWYHPYKSFHLGDKREALFADLQGKVYWNFKDTKPYLNRISRGCELCGQGEWSCLFVTGICNANCFYCPAQQTSDETPQTQKLLFENPQVYVDYINRFKFKGVSLSGGEPLMVFDRTLEFIRQVRLQCDPGIYIWMYTNGILVSDDKLEKLAAAGLDEIRFDIGAVNYQAKVLKNAAKFIPNVTVEIPAVPDHQKQLLAVLPTLVEYGVRNLNLHQLRLTEYNAPKLLTKAYTYLHGEQPTVAESEIAAFEIMQFVHENKLDIGVNYCNFQFKNRFQKAGFRNKMAAVLKKESEEITANGYLRKIITEEHDVLSFKSFRESFTTRNKITLSYEGRVIENIQKDTPLRSFLLNDVEYFIEEGPVTSPIVLEGELISGFIEMMKHSGGLIPDDPLLFKAWRFEFIENGMREFF